MKKITFWCAVFSCLFFSTPSFASSREQSINRELTIIEAINSAQMKKGFSAEMQAAMGGEKTPPPKNNTISYASSSGEEELPGSRQKTTSRDWRSGKSYLPEDYRSTEVDVVSPEERQDSEKNNFYFTTDSLMNHINYEETDGRNVLDKDYGNLKGFYGAMGYRSKLYVNDIMGKPFIEGYFLHYDNLITYDGATLAGTPVIADQKQDVKRFGIKVGSLRDVSEKQELFGYFDVGRRIWHRGETDGTGDYAEKYFWTYLGIGGGINYKPIPKLSLGLDLEWMFTTINPKLWADLGDGFKFNLGRTFGAEVQAPIKYRILDHLSLDLTPFFTYWQIAKSNLVPIPGIPNLFLFEPDSTTYIKGIRAGLTFDF